MTLQFKKTIAREFLVLVLTACITFILYLLLYCYNLFYENKKETLSKQIIANTNFSDSLSKNLKTKIEHQFAFAQKYYKENHNDNNPRNLYFYDEFSIPRMGKTRNLILFERLNSLSQNDSLLRSWKDPQDFKEFGETFNFATPENFRLFVKDNVVTNDDILQSNQSKSIDIKIKSLQKDKVNTNKKIISGIKPNLIYKIFFSAMLITFICRYIYYGVKWSIKILKEKQN